MRALPQLRARCLRAGVKALWPDQVLEVVGAQLPGKPGVADPELAARPNHR